MKMKNQISVKCHRKEKTYTFIKFEFFFLSFKTTYLIEVIKFYLDIKIINTICTIKGQYVLVAYVITIHIFKTNEK